MRRIPDSASRFGDDRQNQSSREVSDGRFDLSSQWAATKVQAGTHLKQMMGKSGQVRCRGRRSKNSVGTTDAGCLEVGFDLARIAAATSQAQPRAASLLEILMSISRASAAALTLRDNDSDRLRVWVAHNYRPEIIDYATRVDTLCHDMAYRSILQNPAGSPMRTWDDPHYGGGRYCNSSVARQLLLPSGFRGGMSARLTTTDGRHVGNFHMNTRDPFDPGRNEVAAYERSFEVVATFMEKSVQATGESEPIVLIENGRPIDLADCPRAQPLSELLPVVSRYTARTENLGRNCAFRWRSPDHHWFYVEMRRTRSGLQVQAFREALPYQLTGRELQVLDCLCVGLTNSTIAAQLGISGRTAEHHVERILEKLAVPTRTAAAAVAVQEGLLLSPVPSEASMGRSMRPHQGNSH